LALNFKFLNGVGVRYGSGTGMCLGIKPENAVKANLRRVKYDDIEVLFTQRIWERSACY